MVHVPNEVYRELAGAIQDGANGYWEFGLFCAEISSHVEYEKRYTGVEFMGDRESYLEPVVIEWDVQDFAFGEDGESTDFDKSILAQYISQ